jgi:thiol-disulfide isomerase/thioredoxin
VFPCREEHPVLMELKNNDRLKVIGMNYKDTKKMLKIF